MQFSRLPDCTHDLVLLRPLEVHDLPAWFGYLSLPRVVEHTSWNLRAVDDLASYVTGAEPATPSSRLRLAIALRSTGELIGTAGFHTVSPENRSAEIAYDLAPSMWGKGIASHVCAALTGWAHGDAGVMRVQATTLESNTRSCKVLERCGFRREGLLRSFRMVRGRPGDFFMYSHLDRDALRE
jgi:ribosomal-protein-alanine N-acetyltransferase